MTDTDRVAVVTGGSRGIGLAICRSLQESGVRVVAGSRQADNKQSAGHDCLPLDVRSMASVNEFARSARQLAGPADILVNCAGVCVHQLVSEHTEEDWLNVIDTNLSGAFRTTRALMPSMKQRKWGRIINIASTAANTAVADSAAYSASKSGLLGLSRATAVEGAPFGVTCVTISPTWVATEMLHDSAREIAAQSGRPVAEVLDGIAQSNPQNRLVQPQEIGALVSFLCSDAAAGITMEDIQINAAAHW